MEKKVKRQVILLSILLHILFLAFWDNIVKLNIAPDFSISSPAPVKSAPLIFDLQQPELPREVIATPADAKTAKQPQKADFLSDKNALARNQVSASAEVPVANSPFSRGDFESHDLIMQPSSLGMDNAAVKPEENPVITEKSHEFASTELPNNGNTLAAGPSQPETKTPFQLDLPGVVHNHNDSQVAESGDLSFNTYNWDFAPYMLELKERISRNIYPPLAFSQLGMIDGDTLLRFKIYPNGELRDLELLAYQGHRSLMETSTMAIKVSAPFRKLPGNFPEPYLEVTAKFSFLIKNKRG